MSRQTLRWWLWSALTLVVMLIAGLFGFYRLLLANDVTFLSFGVIGAYVITTVWIGAKLRAGDRDFGFVSHIAKTMSYVGVLGTFIGLAIAFQALATLPADGTIPPDFKASFMHAVGTKFFCSIVGVIGFIFLETQVRILESSDAQP